MTGILPAARVSTMHPHTHCGIYDTAGMPRGPSYVLNSYIDMIFRNSSDGGKIGAESRVKLACKRVFVSIFTSDGHPMLLDRSFSVKKMSRLNCYFDTNKFKRVLEKFKYPMYNLLRSNQRTLGSPMIALRILK